MKQYWDKLELGHKLSFLNSNPITRVQMAQFAALAKDFSPLYLDDDFAKGMGFASAFVPNILLLSILEESLLSFANNMTIISLAATFHRITRPNDKLTPHGLLTQHYKQNEEYRIKLNLWCTNQHNDVVLKAQSICLLFKNEQHEKECKSNHPPISSQSHLDLLAKWQEINPK